MSIRLQLFCLFLLVLISISFFSYAQNSAKRLTINTIDYPPYSMLNSADHILGHDVEVITRAFEQQGIAIEFNQVPIKRS